MKEGEIYTFLHNLILQGQSMAPGKQSLSSAAGTDPDWVYQYRFKISSLLDALSARGPRRGKRPHPGSTDSPPH